MSDTQFSCECGRTKCHDEASERDSLKAELERLKGKTGCCMQCEQYARDLENLKSEYDNFKKIFRGKDLYCGRCLELEKYKADNSALRLDGERMAKALS